MNLGIKYVSQFVDDPEMMFTNLVKSVNWNNEIKSRKTASFGVPYNSSNIKYSNLEIPKILQVFFKDLNKMFGFTPNNILLNYYYEGSSKMGFHSDDLSILQHNTGVIIISLGCPRVMRFKHKISGEVVDFLIEKGSLLYLSPENQNMFLHSILPSNIISDQRISITMRKILA